MDLIQLVYGYGRDKQSGGDGLAKLALRATAETGAQCQITEWNQDFVLAGNSRGKNIVVCHSFGAAAAMRAIRAARAIGVDKLLMTEPVPNPWWLQFTAFEWKIPSNVLAAACFYQTNDPLLHGTPIKGVEDKSKTAAYNLDCSKLRTNDGITGELPFQVPIHHLNFADHPEIQNKLIAEIKSTVGGGR